MQLTHVTPPESRLTRRDGVFTFSDLFQPNPNNTPSRKPRHNDAHLKPSTCVFRRDVR